MADNDKLRDYKQKRRKGKTPEPESVLSGKTIEEIAEALKGK